MKHQLNMVELSNFRTQYKKLKHLYAHKKGTELIRSNVIWQPVLKSNYRRLSLDEFMQVFGESKQGVAL